MESSTEEWIVRNLLLCLATVARDGNVAFFWLVHWEDAFGTRLSPQERLTTTRATRTLMQLRIRF